MAGEPGATKTKTFDSAALGALAKNWRTKLPKQVGKLPVTGLTAAFDGASAILVGRSDTEVQKIAQDLRQLIENNLPTTSTKGGTDFQGLNIDPRTIYALHAPFNAEHALDVVALGEHLAIATLLELTRACDAYSDAHDQSSWIKAAQTIANARVLSEWIYVIHTLLAKAGQAAKNAATQDIRAAVKAKIKKDKSEAAKKGSRKAYKPQKQLVFDYYEKHKPEFKSLAKAASTIAAKPQFDFVEYTTIYNWLRKYVKKQGKMVANL